MIYQMVKGLSKITTSSYKVLPDITILKFTVVNAFLVGNKDNWILVDTGLENSADYIIKTTEEQFGPEAKPAAIILTHGHFDHIGSVKQLAEHWNVTVYAHENEIPYLTGTRDYPQADPTVDEGLIAKMSVFFPHEGIDLGDRIKTLPSEGRIPGMEELEWVPTPGHSPGHISLFRVKDKTLIVGDAFTTTKQESFWSVLTQKEEVKGPPAYLTTDWVEAEDSVERLRCLQPELVLPSHGEPLKGDELKNHLIMLTEHFDEKAVPREGRFTKK
ncbi:MAG: beta-lactamase domain protein [Herbinix sp.]|nr:beta-lactamase domain protein [Herbinix sp.]